MPQYIRDLYERYEQFKQLTNGLVYSIEIKCSDGKTVELDDDVYNTLIPLRLHMYTVDQLIDYFTYQMGEFNNPINRVIIDIDHDEEFVSQMIEELY